MVTLVVSGLGYESELKAFQLKAQTLGEAYRKLYAKVNDYSLEDLKEEIEDEDLSKRDWNSKSFWLDRIEGMDSSDFVLGSIYHVEKQKFLYRESY